MEIGKQNSALGHGGGGRRLDRGRGPNLLSACLQINKKKNTKTDPKLCTKTGT